MALKTGGRAILIGAATAAIVAAVYFANGLGYLTAKTAKPSEVPKVESISSMSASPSQASFQHGGAPAPVINIAKADGTCQVNVVAIPWNGITGLSYANGGMTTQAGSLMDKRGVKAKIERVDMYDQHLAQLAKFAEGVKAGDKCPKEGAAFSIIMGDGYPAFIGGAQETFGKMGQQLQVVGAIGYSRGEDKCIIDKDTNPRGALITGVPGDGDINICIKYASDNGIPVNTDQKTYDPKAMNFVNVKEFTEGDEKFIAGASDTRINTETKKSQSVKITGAATWTPGDVKIAKTRGNIKVLASTKEYMWQMPTIVIGNKQWMSQNAKFVENFLAAAFEGGELVRSDSAALMKAAEINSVIFKEQNAEYWAKYFKGTVENGIALGGSTTNGLGDNLFLFGLNGNDNLYQRVYTVFGNVAIKHYPEFLTKLVPYDEVVNTNYLKTLAANAKGSELVAAKPTYDPAAPKQTFAKRAVSIEFETGKANITSAGVKQLNDVLDQLSISGLRVQVNGHTDNVGDPAANQLLSKRRAEAIREWLIANAGSSFPPERVSARGYGDTEPIADNKTAAGKAQNRRAELVLLTSGN
jgi:outer membrane protein OmpA-like peptidoglycan-associated protein